MREIIFDVETTGLEARNGDRIIEIGAIEMIDKQLTGKKFHYLINPQDKKISPEAQAVHGISNDELKDKPTFEAILPELLEFFGKDKLVAHNANFDIEFINAELKRCAEPPIEATRIIDTLEISRKKFPSGRHTLDALCKRFDISIAHRTLHGALLDSELLAQVYLELTGHSAKGLALENKNEDKNEDENENKNENEIAEKKTTQNKNHKAKTRPTPLPSRLTEKEQQAHKNFITTQMEKSFWNY